MTKSFAYLLATVLLVVGLSGCAMALRAGSIAGEWKEVVFTTPADQDAAFQAAGKAFAAMGIMRRSDEKARLVSGVCNEANMESNVFINSQNGATTVAIKARFVPEAIAYEVNSERRQCIDQIAEKIRAFGVVLSPTGSTS